MEKVFECLIYFGVSFAICFVLFLIVNKKRKKELDKNRYSFDIVYFSSISKTPINKGNYMSMVWITSIINSFIIAFTSSIILLFKSYLYKLLVGFVLVFVLIYSLYALVGTIYRRKKEK